jgi:quercetin dioxygenase-like cupin family protein
MVTQTAMFVRNAASTAQFSAEKMGKTTLAKGAQLFAGLNCFEPGQQHAMHSHAGQDKLYVVMEGTAIVQIGEKEETLSAGDVAFAADGVPHGVKNPGPGRLVMMAVLAPAPK